MNWKKFFMPFLIGLVLVFSYQNCADVKLAIIEPSVTLNSKFAGEFCSKTTEFKKVDVKLVFMIDMSSSNIDFQNDLEGTRLDLVEDLLTTLDDEESCFNGANLEIAVLGFAREIIGAESQNICVASRFVDPATALTHLQLYRDKHDEARAQREKGQNVSSSLNGTSYTRAVDCVVNVVSGDLPTDDSYSGVMYQTYFLTDGDPTDNVDTAVLKENLRAKIGDLKVQVQQKAFSFIFQPVLYGSLAVDDGNDVDSRNRALQVLGAMAGAGGSIVKNTSDVSELNFCSLANSGSNRTYKVKRFGAINLTAKAVGDRLLPDSDMDGIVDEEELMLGYDPQKARSKYIVLDGICKNGICSGLEQINDCKGVNALGLTQCDVDKLNLTDGLDSDKDLLPDFIEIIKSTDPVSNNDNYRNSDNDNWRNYTEVLQGSDPVSFDEDLSHELLMKYAVEKSPVPFSDCELPQESWSFSLEQVPLVATKATNNSDIFSLSKAYLNHEEGENVIFVYYIVSEELEEGEENEVQYLYGEFFKISPGKAVPTSQGFRLMGSLNGSFKVGD